MNIKGWVILRALPKSGFFDLDKKMLISDKTKLFFSSMVLGKD